ncbi:MAG: hypothetical protein K6G04_01660 [Lachnospiraceae bacterium]|nr:hypothetical protein [Lachnospiraceae bacterium]
MKNMLRRLNQALPELILGILIYGVLVEAIGVWFVSDRIRYTIGLLCGLGCAIFMAVHIALVIEHAVHGGGQPRILAAKSVLRYLVVTVVLVVMMVTKIGGLIPAFIGILGLKVSAYAQPLLHKQLFHNLPEEEITQEDEEVKQ